MSRWRILIVAGSDRHQRDAERAVARPHGRSRLGFDVKLNLFDDEDEERVRNLLVQ